MFASMSRQTFVVRLSFSAYYILVAIVWYSNVMRRAYFFLFNSSEHRQSVPRIIYFLIQKDPEMPDFHLVTCFYRNLFLALCTPQHGDPSLSSMDYFIVLWHLVHIHPFGYGFGCECSKVRLEIPGHSQLMSVAENIGSGFAIWCSIRKQVITDYLVGRIKEELDSVLTTSDGSRHNMKDKHLNH